MISVEVFGHSTAMSAVAELFDATDGVTRVRVVDATRPEHSVVIAAVRPRVTDPLLADLRRLGVPAADVTLARVEVVGRTPATRGETSLVWEDVLGTAWVNARPIARYIAFMAAAGIVGCYGVLDASAILIVGAMAISPDLLPITAIGVGVAARRPALAGRGLLTVTLGLGIACLAGAGLALILDLLDSLPSDFSLAHSSSALGGLTEVSNETIVVALVAGAVGMLALETRASSGVGVAISVTTIPAAAYLGVAAGVGNFDQATGALGVLCMNVAMMAIGASTTLILQRLMRNREDERGRTVGGAHDDR